MKKQNKQILITRLKSLGWRAGMMFLAMVVDFTLENIGLFEMSAEMTVFSGLVLGEISKYLNTK